MKRILVIAAALVAVGVFVLLRNRFLPPATTPLPHNLILISLDTLRADRLGCYGYARETSPNIDRFARRSVVFVNTVAESSWTLTSHVTMLTGLYPSSHGVVNRQQRASSKLVLLPEILRRHGYYNFAVVDGGYVSRRRGFDQGFDHFRRADGNVGTSLAKVRERMEILEPDQPFFAFVHTYDLHCPYTPPEPYYSMFKSPAAEPIDTERRCGERYAFLDTTAAQARFIGDRYDGGIRWLDENLRRFLDYLDSSGVRDRTTVILTSDHGEEFLEHGHIGHRWGLHREALMVPLIISSPVISPARIEELVGLVDLTPTLLDLMDLPIPEVMEGLSLVPLMRAETGGTDRPAFRLSELTTTRRYPPWEVPEGPRERLIHEASSLDDDYHLIVDLESGAERLYDIRRDPHQRHDLAPALPLLAQALRQKLLQYIVKVSDVGKSGVEDQPTLTPEERERLEALGYLGN